MTMSLDEKYRPRRFSDFEGQSNAVEILSRLAKRKIRRNILLKGDLGSGKTSFAHVYARALFCESLLADGSPCNSCGPCCEHEYLFEYDTALHGGDLQSVTEFLQKVDFAARTSAGAVAFLDECHVLTKQAMDAFLKRLERRDSNTVYVFATTESSSLKRTFLSRLMKIDVRALTLPIAIRFLERIAAAENISVTKDGLSLIAAFEEGYPRAMLTALEMIRSADQKADLETVKSHYGRDRADCLVDYMLALADGDGPRQTQVFQGWPGALSDKVAAVQGFLTTFYYNNVRGEDVVGYPLAYALKAERAKVARQFCLRWGAADPSALESRWLRMLNFWNDGARASLQLSIPIFEDLVNRGLDLQTSSVGIAAADIEQINGGAKHQTYDSHPLQSVEKDDRFFEFSDAYAIINRSSFFLQAYGVCMNASFVISPGFLAEDEDVKSAVRRFRDKIEQEFGGEAPFGTILLFERSHVVMGRILAHIPRLKEASIREQLKGFCKEYRDPLYLLVELSLSGIQDSQAKAQSFHWHETLRLCGGLQQDDAAGDRHSHVVRLLKERRPTQMLRAPFVEFSGAIHDAALTSVDLYSPPFISALDENRLDAVTSGWEFDEHKYRIEQADQRRQQFEELNSIYGQTQQGVRAREELKLDWATEDVVRASNWKNRQKKRRHNA